ncbi:MAG TPA: hypothetical protein VNZ22_18790, partial [Bacillota bacterium]|nr:hypothetical protein [Bacillota bacterium]
KSQGRGQKVNLLSIQKQIIADTAALSPKAAKDKFFDLATRQNEAAGFGEMYLNALNQAGAPSEPAQLMEQAIREMKQAVRGLTEQNRAEALPAEERALSDLYQVLQRLPELANMPTEPPPQSDEQMEASQMVKVVLEAIQKQKKEQPSNEEMVQALEEAKKLSRSQAGLNQAMERPGQSQEGQTKDGENNANSNAKNGKQSQVAQAADKPGENGNGREKPGDKPGENGARQDQNGDQPGQNGGSQDLEKLAELEQQLSEQAARLAEQLEQMAEKDGRLSQGAGQKMSQAAGQMAAAAQALRQGNASVAGTSGAQGRMNVDKVVAILERLIKDKATLADVTAEDFPPEYESVIADYLKKLSYEQ